MERLTEKVEDRYIARQARLSNGKIAGDKMCLNKLGELEDKQEKGLLRILPCGIGADVYKIPSETNYKLNVLNGYASLNRVYHQKVERITFTNRGWYLESSVDVEYGTREILLDEFYKITWFLNESEAEEALKKLDVLK